MGPFTKNFFKIKKGLNTHGGSRGGGMKPSVRRESDNKAVGVLRLPSPERRGYLARMKKRWRERVRRPPTQPPAPSTEENNELRDNRLAGRIEKKLAQEKVQVQEEPGAGGDAAPVPDGGEGGAGAANHDEGEQDVDQPNEDEASDSESDRGEEEFSDNEEYWEHKDREDGAGAVSPTLEEAPEAVEVEEQEELPSPLLDKDELLRLFVTYQDDQSSERQKRMNNLLEPIFDRTRLGGKAFKLGVVYHSNVELHGDQREGRCFGGEELGAQHESPQRTKAIFDLLLAEGIIAEADFISEVREATDEEIMAVHTANHLANLKKLEKMSYKERDLWCARNDSKTLFANSGTTKAALTSAGGVLLGIDHVLRVGGDQ